MAQIRLVRRRTYRDGVLIEEGPEEQVDITQEFVTNDLRAKALTARAANQTFLALGNPTNAQVLAQVRSLTRQNNGLIRLLLGGGLRHLSVDPALLDDTATDT